MEVVTARHLFQVGAHSLKNKDMQKKPYTEEVFVRTRIVGFKLFEVFWLRLSQIFAAPKQKRWRIFLTLFYFLVAQSQY